MTLRHVLITGASGQLGTELRRCAWPTDWRVTAVNRGDLDLADPAAIAAIVAQRSWAAVINCAAYTAVDKAETDIVAAWSVNALAPAAFGEACAKASVPLLHVSTDYVFSGDKQAAWEVNDPVAPLGVYGASKLGGELAIQTSGARHVIVRTAWVVSPYGSNFVKTMLRAGANTDKLRVVGDQFGTPTNAADLADTLMTIAIRLAVDSYAPTGIFHFSNSGVTSWAGFAQEIFRQSLARGGPYSAVASIATVEYPTAARRPANSRLSHEAIQTAYDIIPRPWAVALSDILDELIGKLK